MKEMKKSLFYLIIILLIPLILILLFSQERGFKVVAKTTDGEILNLYRECHALLIGVSDYLYGWPDLPNASQDVDDLEKILTKLGFKVKKVKNPTSDEMRKALNTFVFGPGQKEDNCLVIFYAGHGHTERLAYGEDMGYIVPKDAPLPERDRGGFMQKAIDMRTIEAFSRRIEAKHALFLFDSCFSGAIFDMVRAIPTDIKYKTGLPVRQFITAGQADELVPDRSIFKSQLIDALGGEADRNDDGYVTGTELGEFLQEKVVNYTYGSQHPQYGKIRDPRLDKGDIVFPLEKKLAELEKLSASTRPEAVLEPRYGSIEIVSNIDGAKVYRDGKYEGTTKKGYAFVIKKVLVGEHTVLVSHDKYKDYKTPVKVSEGQRVKMAPKFLPLKPGEIHTINISSVPKDARVVIDGVESGETPFKKKIKQGFHLIRIEKEGYKSREENVEIKSDFIKKYNLEKLGYGYLIISFHPFAEVEIDGKKYGEVPPPLEVKLYEGKHTVKFIYSRYRKERILEVNLAQGERKRIHRKSEFYKDNSKDRK